MPKYTQRTRAAVGRRVYRHGSRSTRSALGARDKYGGFRSDYLYPVLQRGGRTLSPVWEGTKSAYRKLSPSIYNVAAPVVRGVRMAANLSPIIYNAASLARYSSPLMDRTYGYTQDAASALAAYDALTGPRVTGSLAGAGIHGAQGLYHGYKALSHLYSADPLKAAMHSAYALSHGQRAAREGFAHLRNKYLYSAVAPQSTGYRRRPTYMSAAEMRYMRRRR
jgi:hypothetical protein